MKITSTQLRNLIREYAMDVPDPNPPKPTRGNVASFEYSFDGGQSLTVYFNVEYEIGERASKFFERLPDGVDYKHIQETDLVDSGLVEDFEDDEVPRPRGARQAHKNKVAQILMYYAKKLEAEAGMTDSRKSRIIPIEDLKPELSNSEEIEQSMKDAMNKLLDQR